MYYMEERCLKTFCGQRMEKLKCVCVEDINKMNLHYLPLYFMWNWIQLDQDRLKFNPRALWKNICGLCTMNHIWKNELHYLERIILKSPLHVFRFLAFKIIYGFNVLRSRATGKQSTRGHEYTCQMFHNVIF